MVNPIIYLFSEGKRISTGKERSGRIRSKNNTLIHFNHSYPYANPRILFTPKSPQINVSRAIIPTLCRCLLPPMRSPHLTLSQSQTTNVARSP